MATFISQDFSASDGTVITTLPGWSNLSGSTGGAENLIVSGNAIRTALSSGTTGAQNSLAAAASDMTVVAQLKCISAANTTPGVVARLLNGSNYYFARVSQSSQICEIYKVVSGSATLIDSAAFELLAGQSVEFAFEIVGSTLRVLRDGAPALSVTDSSIASGSRVGIRWSTSVAVGASSGTHIDSFVGYDGAYVSTGSTPAGTINISDVNPGETSAVVTYSYDDTDQTGFEYRIDGGTAASLGASPATITGLTASTEYDIEVRAVNASGAGAWSAVETFTTDAASDTTAPVLSSPTGVETGATTADGSVSTDEGNGTLYAVVTTSATPPSAADIRTGTGAVYATSQAVSGTGVQDVSATGLTASTTYYWHFLHDDAAANASNIATSASFTTDAAAGTVTVTEPLKNNTGTLRSSESGVKIAVLQAADLASVYETTTTTDGSGMIPAISSAQITPAASYHVAIKLADGSVGITGAITAS